MNMVLYFNKKDMVEFGEFLLSDERKKQIQKNYNDDVKERKENIVPVEERLKGVTHCDVENWKYLKERQNIDKK